MSLIDIAAAAEAVALMSCLKQSREGDELLLLAF